MFWRSRSTGRLIAKLAIIAGMRPGEIFALIWGRLTATYADIRQRVYRRKDNSTRQAALSEGLPAEIEKWRMMAVETRDDAWVFPSERTTPLYGTAGRRSQIGRRPAGAYAGREPKCLYAVASRKPAGDCQPA
jgi:integrase